MTNPSPNDPYPTTLKEVRAEQDLWSKLQLRGLKDSEWWNDVQARLDHLDRLEARYSETYYQQLTRGAYNNKIVAIGILIAVALVTILTIYNNVPGVPRASSVSRSHPAMLQLLRFQTESLPNLNRPHRRTVGLPDKRHIACLLDTQTNRRDWTYRQGTRTGKPRGSKTIRQNVMCEIEGSSRAAGE